MNRRDFAVWFLFFLLFLAIAIIAVNALQTIERQSFKRNQVEEWAEQNNVTITHVDVALVTTKWVEVEAENEFLGLLSLHLPNKLLWSRQYGYSFFARQEQTTYYLTNGVVLLN